MPKSFPYNLYRGTLVVAHVDWEPGSILDPDGYVRGFDVAQGAATFYVPDADETILVTIGLGEKISDPSTGALRAIRVPFDVVGDLMVSNIDIEDDMPFDGVPIGRYSLQFELHPALVHHGDTYAYDVRLAFVPDENLGCAILVSGHAGVSAEVRPVAS